MFFGGGKQFGQVFGANSFHALAHRLQREIHRLLMGQHDVTDHYRKGNVRLHPGVFRASKEFLRVRPQMRIAHRQFSTR